MKKLALAFVCLASLAFFASCGPENQSPTINVLVEQGYVQNNENVDQYDTVYFGFQMSSCPETLQKLASLVVTIDGVGFDTVDLTGKDDYTYRGGVVYTPDRDSLVGQSLITAIVTDAAGMKGSASITLNIFSNAQPLEPKEFAWYRLAGTQTGDIESLGLKWENNLKVTHAQIKPLEGVKLYIFSDVTVWDETKTDVEKAALFHNAIETMKPSTVYNNVSTNESATYNDVIGTITTDGQFHLIHVTKCEIGAFVAAGYPITISGEVK